MHFRILNIPVYIHPSFWIFLLFFTNVYNDFSIASVICGIVMFFSLLVHECGHALTARFFGAEPTITLQAFGGFAQYDGRRITPKQHLWITLNGPLLESFLIAIAYTLLKSGIFAGHPYVEYFLFVTMRLNIMWVLLNLIPVLPLDGGALLHNVLESKFGFKGHKAGMYIGIASAIIIAPYLFLNHLFFFGTLILMCAFRNMQALQHSRSAAGETNPFKMQHRGEEALNNNDLVTAKAIFKKLLKSKDAQTKHAALSSLAKVYCRENESEKAYELLQKADPSVLKEGKCLFCRLAYERKHYEFVCIFAREIYEIEPTFETALLNSKAFAGVQKPMLAGAWLFTAAQFGPEFEEKAQEALSDDVYLLVREDAAFKEQYDSRLCSNVL